MPNVKIGRTARARRVVGWRFGGNRNANQQGPNLDDTLDSGRNATGARRCCLARRALVCTGAIQA
jgi:hypothetical protein